MPRTALANQLPPRPRAVLRLGFAGRRELGPEAEEPLRVALQHVFAIIGRRLAALTPGSPERTETGSRVAAFFADRLPLLRLVTGLCEGADTVAAQELERLAITHDDPHQQDIRCLETELAAVLPFDPGAYRDSRPAWFRAEFDRQAERCGYMVTIDGIHQSAVDWLFSALARAVSPASLAIAETLPTHDGAGALQLKVLRLQPLQTLAAVRDRWVAEQVVYHARNARAMERLEHFAESAGAKLSRAVVYIVALDIVIVALDLAHLLPHALAHLLHGFTPWLIFLAAVLPAAVASLNGLRFQSECRHLAERSAMLRVILGGRPAEPKAAKTEPGSEPELTGGRWHETATLAARVAACTRSSSGSSAEAGADIAAWSLDTLLLTERIADDCVREVAEWSVLYAKQLPET